MKMVKPKLPLIGREKETCCGVFFVTEDANECELYEDEVAWINNAIAMNDKLTNFLKQCASFADSQDAFDSCALNGIAINAKALLDKMGEE